MKSVIKVANMNSNNDVRAIQEAISNNDGIIASEVSLKKKEIIVIYNENFLNADDIVGSIEDAGYWVE